MVVLLSVRVVAVKKPYGGRILKGNSDSKPTGKKGVD
jgi:hypothetical protein